MGALLLQDRLHLAFWLLLFSEVFLLSAQGIIRDHCRRVRTKQKLKVRGKRNEKRICAKD